MKVRACCGPSNQGVRPAVPVPLRNMGREMHALKMIPLEGGNFLMGTDTSEAFVADGEGPVREVELSPYHLQQHPVTNREFASFVHSSGYVTEAERFGWSFVFWAHVDAALVADTVTGTPWWCKVDGASWKHPEGRGTSVDSRMDHPVVHVSWNDALAFCEWFGVRLPTEAEWEFAARGGLIQATYPWGNELCPDGEHRCNIWQGEFPLHDTGEDGFTSTSPVEAFPPNRFGFFSIAGNTWEWCADWFDAEFHRIDSRRDPQGPQHGSARVIKGGSFLCHKSYCNRYRVAARSSNTPDSSTSHMGFRVAASSPLS